MKGDYISDKEAKDEARREIELTKNNLNSVHNIIIEQMGIIEEEIGVLEDHKLTPEKWKLEDCFEYLDKVDTLLGSLVSDLTELLKEGE